MAQPSSRAPRRSLGRLYSLIALVAIVLGVAVMPQMAQAASPLTWSAPEVIDHQEHLSSISCPSTSLCVAVGEAGNLLTSTNPTGGAGTWSAPVDVDGGQVINEVSCPTTTLCVAVAGKDALISTNPIGGARAWVSTQVDPEADADAETVSCPSTSLCVIMNDTNDIVTSTDPTGGAGSWTVSHLSRPTITSYAALTCPSETLCIAANNIPEEALSILSSGNPTGGWSAWSKTGGDPGPIGGLMAASCPTTTLCVGADLEGRIVTTTTPAAGPWTFTSHIDGNNLLLGLSCATTTLCVGAGSGGEIVTSTDPTSGGSAWETARVDGENTLAAVSCPHGTMLCVAVDDIGNVLVGAPPSEEHGHPAEEESPPSSGGSATTGTPSTGSSTSTGSSNTTPIATISSAQIAALLGPQLIPSGKAGTIPSLLKHGGLTMPFTAPEAGTLVVQWYEVPAGASLATHSKAKPVLVASGQLTFSVAGTEKIKMRLTAVGKQLLRHAKRLRVTAKATFVGASKTHGSAMRVFVMRR
jgi:hypothetical protein